MGFFDGGFDYILINKVQGLQVSGALEVFVNLGIRVANQGLLGVNMAAGESIFTAVALFAGIFVREVAVVLAELAAVGPNLVLAI